LASLSIEEVKKLEDFYAVPDKIFLNSHYYEQYVCSICSYVPLPGIAVENKGCGHIFCEPCISKWVSMDKDRCPNCNQNISDTLQIIKDNNKGMYRVMSSLEVKCITEKTHDGKCKWKGTLGSLEDHLLRCKFYPVNCRKNCGKVVIRKNLEKHEKNECVNRKIKCNFCDQEFVFEKMNQHVDHCDKNPDKIRKCKYSFLGCVYESKGKDIIKHEDEAAKEHLALSLKQLAKYVKFELK